ncbi:MAG TPA: HD domain-containing phosphohydrolase [Abditibacteriaceae bacterium]|jgi:hypothetical protein
MNETSNSLPTSSAPERDTPIAGVPLHDLGHIQQHKITAHEWSLGLQATSHLSDRTSSSALRTPHLPSSGTAARRPGPNPDPLLTSAEEILIASEHKLPGGVAHARLVCEVAAAVGVEIGLRADHYTVLACAGLLHDIGCCEWPAQLLSKPGRWNAGDVLRAQRHPVSGASLIAELAALKEAGVWVRQHHERTDGSGYPDSLRREHTSPEGRLLAVVEVFAACVTPRPFRRPLSPRATVARLKGAQESSGAFAPDVPNVKENTSERVGAGLDPIFVEATLAALHRAASGQPLENMEIWPAEGLAFDSPILRRALCETFSAITDCLLHQYESVAGWPAAQRLRQQLNANFAAHSLPVRFAAKNLQFDHADQMSAVEISALALRTMTLQAELLDSLLEVPCAMRLRYTAHSSLTLWGQELAERYGLLDGLALHSEGTRPAVHD